MRSSPPCPPSSATDAVGGGAGLNFTDWVHVSAPATSANLGPGFDTLGLALEWRQAVRCRLAAAGLEIQVSGNATGAIPTDESNLVARAARAVLEQVGHRDLGLRIVLDADLPVGGGLGSSAAAVAAGLTAANALCGNQLGVDQLLQMGTAIEGHPDNLAPALLGGVCVACQGAGPDRPVLAVRLEPPPDLEALVAIPNRHLQTREARQVLPSSVPFADAVANVQRASLLVAAVATGRLQVLVEATRDRLHEPYRATLLPGLTACREQAVAAGALGAFLSGAGSSLLVLWPSGQAVAPGVAEALATYLGRNGGGTVRRLRLAVGGVTAIPCAAPDERMSP